MAVMASQAGLVSFPAATNAGAGLMRASTSAQTARARAPQDSTWSRNASNVAMTAAYAAPRRDPAVLGRCGRDRAPERVTQLRGPGRCDVRRQFFLAGTAVGSAGLAVRARVTRAEVALAGAFLAAGVGFFAVAGLGPHLGAPTALSGAALGGLAGAP